MTTLKLGQTSNTAQINQHSTTKAQRACRSSNKLTLSHLIRRKPCEHNRIRTKVESLLRSYQKEQVILGFFALCVGKPEQTLVVGFQVFTQNQDQFSLMLPASTNINRSKLFHTHVRPLLHTLKQTGHRIVTLRGTHSKQHDKLISTALDQPYNDYGQYTNMLAQSKIDRAERIFQRHQSTR